MPSTVTPTPSLLRLVVVDDEQTSRSGLVRMLHELPEVAVVGEAGDVDEAVELIDRVAPDGLLLDIRLPTGTGFDILQRIDRHRPFVFVTAYHTHAIAAFELAALDYLLKPFTPERLQTAIERLRQASQAGERDLAPQLDTVKDLITTGQPVDRLFVRRGRRIVMLPTDDIHRIEADGMYTRIITAQETYVVTIPLHTILSRLPGDDFARVHRSHIVNFRCAAGFSMLPNGRLQVEMRKGPPVPCSREYSRVVRQRVW